MQSFVADLLPVLALFAAGAAAGRYGLIGDEAADGMKKLVASVTLPVLLFSAFAGTRIEAAHLVLVAAVFLSCALMGWAGSRISRSLNLPSPAATFLFQGFEAGMLGYALFEAFFGRVELSRFATADLGQVVYVFTVLMSQMLKPARNGTDNLLDGTTSGRPAFDFRAVAGALKSLLKSPVILAIAAGIVVSLLFGQTAGKPWGPGGFLEKTLSLVGGLTTPLVCISVGYGLRNGVPGARNALKTVLARMAIAIPLSLVIAYLLLPAIGMPIGYSRAVVVLFLLPSPYVIAIFRRGRDESAYISATLSLHTAISLAAIIIFAFLTSGGALSGGIASGGAA